MCIAQGFALHVNENAERLRGKLVRHEGQVTIAVQREDFVRGSSANAWPEVFGAFSDAIAKHLGRQRDLMVCDFATTGPRERGVEIVLNDAVQRYFRYEVHTLRSARLRSRLMPRPQRRRFERVWKRPAHRSAGMRADAWREIDHSRSPARSGRRSWRTSGHVTRPRGDALPLHSPCRLSRRLCP
jgi:hypothetical protein